jgi:cysteine desulfurase
VPIEVRRVPGDYLLPTRHKFHAPKGVGVLYARCKAPMSHYVCGGNRSRSGREVTEGVPLMVDIGRAAERARKHLPIRKGKLIHSGTSWNGPARDHALLTCSLLFY